MISQQINQLLWDYKAVIVILICLWGQITAWRFWRRRFTGAFSRSLLKIFFIAANLAWALTVHGLYRDDAPNPWLWSWINRPAIAWQLIHPFFLIPLAAALKIPGWLLWLFRKMPARPRRFVPARRGFLKTLTTLGCGGFLAASGYGVWRQGQPPQVNRLTVISPDLDPALDGLRIAQIADLHLGLWASQKEVFQALEAVAEEKPDLVTFGGDMVDRNPEIARLYHEPLKLLAGTPLGVWGILGNHDHYNQPDRITELLNGRGINILRNRQVHFQEIPLTLIGLDDPGRGHSWSGREGLFGPKVDQPVLRFDRLTGPARPPENYVVLLNHRPEGLAQAAVQDCDLYLAAHTHGGQYQAPWDDQANLAGFFYQYTSGPYRQGRCLMNVTRGVASVGAPFRLWAWPEVNIITLKK